MLCFVGSAQLSKVAAQLLANMSANEGPALHAVWSACFPGSFTKLAALNCGLSLLSSILPTGSNGVCMVIYTPCQQRFLMVGMLDESFSGAPHVQATPMDLWPGSSCTAAVHLSSTQLHSAATQAQSCCVSCSVGPSMTPEMSQMLRCALPSHAKL